MANGTAGYAAENIALAAAAFKLGSIVMYNIKPPAAVSAARLGKDESPLFIMQVRLPAVKGGAGAAPPLGAPRGDLRCGRAGRSPQGLRVCGGKEGGS